jgi:hypothetical protein
MPYPAIDPNDGFTNTDGTTDQLLFDSSDTILKHRQVHIYYSALTGAEVLTIKIQIRRSVDDAYFQYKPNVTLNATDVQKMYEIPYVSCKGLKVLMTQAPWTTARAIRFEVHKL